MTTEFKRQEPGMLWNQYILWIELYKYYLDSAFKANVFFYAITGGILTFYFSNPQKQYVKYALLLPTLISGSFFYIAIYGINKFEITKKEVASLAKQLAIKVYPDLNVLIIVLWIFAITFFIVGTSMVFLILGLIKI
jgi:hypothetical protein